MKVFSFLFFLLGLVFGSFLNCIIYRLYTGEGFFIGRSFCPKCKHILKWKDLIPVFSFLLLKGKCRYCKKPISWQYPLVEIATGLVFLLILNFKLRITNYELLSFENILNFLFLIFIFSFLIVIFVYDLKHYIIPDKVIFPAIVVTLFYQLFKIWNFEFVSDFGFRISDFKILAVPLFSAILASVFFLVIILISGGRWMGFGDVKLAFFMGLFLGFPNILVALFFSFFIGAIIGIGLIIAKKKTFHSEVPFGPFLVSGTFIAFFFGENLISWYLSLLFP
ncbi:prepilin peptidase [bacterium]|nr:prepilin peptidase [bacterium]